MPLSTQERFARAATQLEGVPFTDHGRDPKVGLDCAGLLIAAARKVGLKPQDRPYVIVRGSDYWKPMAEIVEALAYPVEGEWERGDVLGFRYGPMKNHLGVYLGGGKLVHAWDATGIRKVVVTVMDPPLSRKVVAAWRLR